MTSTYRLQFSHEFTFADAIGMVPYLAKLGISHIYASPIFAAVPGSTHGYNVTDHNVINPELGGEQEFRRVASVAAEHGLGWIQDIVPNHMAYSPANPLLYDLFEHGTKSPYWDYFDVDWHAPYQGLDGRLIAPFLGSLYGEVLERGEITLSYGESGFHLNYYEMHFPLRVESYRAILERRLGQLERKLGRDDPEMLKLLGVLYTLEGLETDEDRESRLDKTGFIKRMLWELYTRVPSIRSYVDESVLAVNGGSGESGYDLMNELHWKQVYRLSFWKVAGEEINYRRFFSVNDLICLRVEDRRVFDYTHQLLFSLVEEGLIDGVRVDHIDGLAEPGTYIARLRERLGNRPVFVEKILHEGEQMPEHWQADGTTGYEALNAVGRLFVDGEGGERVLRHYRSFAGIREEVSSMLAAAKRRFIAEHMAGDVENLVRYIKRLLAHDRRAIDITARSLQDALSEVMVQFPVYRTYTTDQITREADVEYVTSAVERAHTRLPEYGYELMYIQQLLLLSFPEQSSQESRANWSDVVRRFQQFTGPLMAKGLEDTVMYAYGPLLCANEVGGDPEHLSAPPQAFHQFVKHLPATSMTTSSTHDTKRGEDTRLRIAMISHHSQEWSRLTREWRSSNKALKRRVNGASAPDSNDEYLIYQILVALVPAYSSVSEDLRGRLHGYLQKSLRESKRHTSWVGRDEAYEKAAAAFLDGLLDSLDRDNESFRAFAGLIQGEADVLIRSHTAIRLLMPGIPDTYRGAELLDLSLVDPDNRRPVDFSLREEILNRGSGGSADPGEQKLALVSRLLHLRRERPDLVCRGGYRPLTVQSGTARVIAFGRGEADGLVVVALIAPLLKPVGCTVGPLSGKAAYTESTTGEHTRVGEDGNLAVELSMESPVRVLVRR